MNVRNISYRKHTNINKNHYECIISICIHDAPDFLELQLNNINKYVSNCIIVLHINNNTILFDENTLPNNVWINPSWYNENTHGRCFMWRGFISNIVYAYTLCTFERVLLLSSSCMFFRTLDWNKIDKNAICVTPIHHPNQKYPTSITEAQNSGVWWYPSAARDNHLISWIKTHDFHRVYGGQLSGTLLPEACIHLLIELSELDNKETYNYPYEEIYPQTIGALYAEKNNLNIYPSLVQIHWYNNDDAYWCLSDFAYDTAKQNNNVYAICKVQHDINGIALQKIKTLQEYFENLIN